MKHLLHMLAIAFLLPLTTLSQNFYIEIPIQPTGGTVNDTLDDGRVVTLLLSSDDAEQENDEVDTPYDDDIDAGWEGAPEDQNILTAGLRFQNIHIPQGAIIDSAFIRVHSHEGKTTEDVAEITIVGEATDHALTFDEENFNNDYLLTDRPETSASVEWEVAEEWVIWQPYFTPDLKNIVQEIVDRPGWKSGNAMAFIFKGNDQGPSTVENAREWEAFENISDPEDEDPEGNPGDGQNHPERAPRLFVYYTASSSMAEFPIIATGGEVNDTLDDGTVVRLQLSSDDAEQENNEVDTPYDDDIDAGWEGAPEDQNILTAGLRFQYVTIPKGVTIDSAFIEVTSHEGKTAEDVAQITIVGEAADFSPSFDEENFNSDYLLTDRPETNASIEWEVAEEWVIWQPYRTPDISTIVQEIIDRSGWETGNPIAFILKGKDQGPSTFENAREWEAFENISDPEDEDPEGNPGDGQNHPERVPKLIVYYSNETIGIFDPAYEANEPLRVYPNPTSKNFVNIKLNSDNAVSITVFNQQGQIVKAVKSEGQNNVTVDLKNAPKGIYILKALQNGVTYTQKLVVK
jgi:hypothetical protein